MAGGGGGGFSFSGEVGELLFQTNVLAVGAWIAISVHEKTSIESTE